jgi:hypothetical protein
MKEKEQPKGEVFKTGVNLTRGKGEVRFEAGDAVPSDLTVAERKALKELGAL